MSFGHHNDMSPHPSGPSFPNNLNKIFNAQTEHIRQLQDQINSRDKALEGLLLQVKNLHVQNQGLTTLPKLKNQETKQHSSSKKGLKKPNQQTLNEISGGSKKLATNRRITKNTKKPSSPIKKKRPHQLTTKEIPDVFEPSKNSFSIRIRTLWGLVYQDSIPMVPDNSHLKKFNTQFKFPADIVQKIHNLSTIPLVPQNEIITFRGLKSGKKKISHGIIKLTNFFIKYILSLLATVGIHFWDPELNSSSDTRYNEACRISAIQTFCQLAAGGAFEYMNINLRFLEDLQLLEATYNHIVYFTLAKRYQKELKEKGKYSKDQERQAILRARLRLKELRYRFGVSQGFPKRYLKILSNVDAHSDDERTPNGKAYFIKTIACRSRNANIFMRRVDEEIEKAERDNGKTSNRRHRLVPDKPVTSICNRVPRGLPIDFYDPSWFNSRTAGQKTLTADSFNVAFLPDASESLRGIQHPDERLGARNFTQKYWDQLIEPYDISHEITNEEDLETSGDSNNEIDDDSEVVSSEDKTDKDEVAQEGELNQLVDQDTEMEHAPDLSNPFGPSEISFQNEWSGW